MKRRRRKMSRKSEKEEKGNRAREETGETNAGRGLGNEEGGGRAGIGQRAV